MPPREGIGRLCIGGWGTRASCLVGFQVAGVGLSFCNPLSPHLHSRIAAVSLLTADRDSLRYSQTL